MERLKSCPCCGGAAKRNDGLYKRQPAHEIECTVCGLTTAFCSDATERWNARKDQS